MAKLSEILEAESQRQDSSTWNVIHLWKDGGFYRVYDWSAWLVVSFAYDVSADRGNKPLAVTRRKIASEELDFCHVGFPIKSLQKFIPSAGTFEPADNSHITVSIDLPLSDSADGYETLSSAFQAWKESLPISEDKPKKGGDRKEQDNAASSRKSLTQIMSQVISYPLERKTPIENTEFISLLKQQLAMLI